MKKILLIFVMVAFIISCNAKMDGKKNAESNLKWIYNLDEAKEIAEKENKTIFVHFTGSDWCGWCIKLDEEVFSKKVFKEYANKNLVLVQLDFPRNKSKVSKEQEIYNQEILQKYGVRGFPTVLVFDKNLKQIGRTGYQRGGPEKYVEHLKEMR